jgi:hypothetical protein
MVSFQQSFTNDFSGSVIECAGKILAFYAHYYTLYTYTKKWFIAMLGVTRVFEKHFREPFHKALHSICVQLPCEQLTHSC